MNKIITDWEIEQPLANFHHYKGDLCFDLFLPKFNERFLNEIKLKNINILEGLDIDDSVFNKILDIYTKEFLLKNSNYTPNNEFELPCIISLNIFNMLFKSVQNLDNRKYFKDNIKYIYSNSPSYALYTKLASNIIIAKESKYAELCKNIDFDLFVVLSSHENYMIPSSTKLLLDEDYSVVYTNKSGISTKFNILMKADTIDNGFKDYISFSLFNTGNSDTVIYSNMNITQGMLVKNLIDSENTEERGKNGFGSGYIKQ